jgi:4-hydroxythreonine-4-phosphate dehydrogenase
MGLTPVRVVSGIGDARFEKGTVDVLDVAAGHLSELQMGEVQPKAGEAAVAWIRRAVELALAGQVDAICTAPINKEAVVRSGVAGFKGHTEFLGELCDVPDPLTMFVVGSLRILFLTRHMSLADAVKQVTAERIERFIPEVDKALRDLGVGNPRIAVAGLNPHSGEGGLFGQEEDREIRPAVARAREKGFDVTGPVPADSVFYQARTGRFDAVVSLYHDQGHIASKTLDFERTVSVTLGLPFIRTSVDHGTAFDIAGKGVASDVSMQEAIKVAADYTARLMAR